MSLPFYPYGKVAATQWTGGRVGRCEEVESRIWKEEVVAYSKCYPAICPVGLRNILPRFELSTSRIQVYEPG
jgi:hypothetical protein